MTENYNRLQDINSDIKSDLKSGTANEPSGDYGGDLAKDVGVDLNAGAANFQVSKFGESATEMLSGAMDVGVKALQASAKIAQVTMSVVSSAASSMGKVEKSDGSDLDFGTTDMNNGTIETSQDEVGEDLNDSGMDVVLDNFQEGKWSELSLEEKKQSMIELANFVANDTGNENPPEIVFRDDMQDGSYGGYNPDSNTIEINQNMLDDSAEAADTISHEMWHAYQQQALNDPSNPRAQEYQEGFDNYISPEYDFEGYQNQMVEAEARDYAQGFKDRLSVMKGAA